jgi:hypothetical protein
MEIAAPRVPLLVRCWFQASEANEVAGICGPRGCFHFLVAAAFECRALFSSFVQLIRCLNRHERLLSIHFSFHEPNLNPHRAFGFTWNKLRCGCSC